MKFGLIALLVGVGLASGATAMVGSDPDSVVANTIQTNRDGKLPGSLERYDDQAPLESRVAILLVHGWSNEPDISSLPAQAVVRATFESAVVDWKARAPQLIEANFEDCFVPFVVHYPPQTDMETNGRTLWYLVEADKELTLDGAKTLVFGHSMGVLVGKSYRNIDDDKCVGLVGNGGPLGGSPLADPQMLQVGLTSQLGAMVGKRVLLGIEKKVDFSLPGIRCLRPDSTIRRRIVETEPFDGSCYIFYGQIEAAKLDPLSVVMDFTDGLDLVLSSGANNAKSAIIYGRMANLISATGGGESDGMVPVTSALANISGAHVIDAGSYDHSQIVRGAGDVWLHDQQLLAMWEIYKTTKKQDPDFGLFDWVVPVDSFQAKDLGSVRLDSPVRIWAVRAGTVAVYGSAAGRWISTGIGVVGGAEPDLDDTGFRVAVPGESGVVVYNLASGERDRIVLKGATAVAWTDDNLLVAQKGRIVLVDPDSGFVRTLVEDAGLLVRDRMVANDKVVWFASSIDASPPDLYKLGLAAVHVKLTDPMVQLVARDISYSPRPTAKKDGVVGIWSDREKTKITWLGRVYDHQLNILLANLVTSSIFAKATDIAVTSDGGVLLLVDGRVRSLNVALAKRVFGEGLVKDALSRIQGGEVRLDYTIDDLAPVLADGSAEAIGAR